MKKEEVVFRHGALADTYEKQANDQGYTLGGWKDFAERLGFGLIAGRMHGVITEKEFERITKRFEKKILVRNLTESEE